MSVTEAQRHELYESFKAAHGVAVAETFMNLHPPIDWDQFATKADLEYLCASMTADVTGAIASLQRHMTTVLIASQAALLVAISLVVSLAAILG